MAKIKKRQLDSKALVIVVVVSILVLLIFYDGVTGKAWFRGGKGQKIYQCNDQVDNDGDGKCDFLWKNAYCTDGSVPGDPGCISKDDNDESSDCVPVCNANSDCGTNGYIGEPYCGADGNVYKDYATYACENAGKCSAVCNERIDSYLWQNCLGYGCSNGLCNQPPGNETA